MDPEESSVDSKLPIVVEAPVAPFVQQLFKMVNSNTLIQWSEDGLVIEVPDPARFAAEICPLYFRHKNWNSFARMMNMYQFAKLPNEPKSKNARFSHPSFRRDGGDLLWKITRQKTATVPRKKKKKRFYAAGVLEGWLTYREIVSMAAPSTPELCRVAGHAGYGK